MSSQALQRRLPAQGARDDEALLMERIHRPHLVEQILNGTLMVVWDCANAFHARRQLRRRLPGELTDWI